ncbi:hypothetical protein CLV88_101749 [Shimia abyssi]|uniref:Uncharacterized protein n=1 Tax=Shimia abyssi TaxID=1662395 RepID=A0A2P8FKU2_9RHOB|nr:hypothetical protein CLV88_101749 [Shimia abyssi]
MVRRALDAELARLGRPAKTANRADEQLLASLRRLLAGDLAAATGWEDLGERLAGKGYALREAGGGLALFALSDERRMCKASELGCSYGSLMKRFGTPFPGHRHQYLVQRLLGRDEGCGVLE